MKANVLQIFEQSVGADTVPVVHGLKSLSMVWVIFGHTCIVVFKVWYEKLIGNRDTQIQSWKYVGKYKGAKELFPKELFPFTHSSSFNLSF